MTVNDIIGTVLAVVGILLILAAVVSGWRQ